MKLVNLTPSRPQRLPLSSRWPYQLLIIALILYAIFKSIVRQSSFSLDHILLSTPSGEHARNWSRYYTSETHVAGQGLKQAQWTKDKWKDFGISNTRIVSYDTKLPRPKEDQRLAVLQDGNVLYEAPLVDSNITKGFIPAYFGFSFSANISGPYVFCNFGRKEDFEDLSKANIDVSGKIGIIKLADVSPYLHKAGLEIFRGFQMSNAEAAGLIGVVFYTDPQNDGPVTESNGYKPFPYGPARPLEGIERGGIGNPEDYRRGLLPRIPCMPMSIMDAIHLMKILNGHGPLATEINQSWEGGALGFYGVKYNIGPSPDNISLRLVNQAEIVDAQVHHVVGSIEGKITDEVVIVGNHRDAWGPGAGDPGSGSAALNEVVRSFGVAVQHGWQPHRTIVFASLEGEEFGIVGALLWIQDHLRWMKQTVVAYLNTVVAAAGPKFHAKASPLLYRTVQVATDQVVSPDQTVPGQSVRDAWGGFIGTAGGGDAIGFIGLPCVSTVDIGFAPGPGDAVFPYHTGFDNFEWMDTVGDSEWTYHVTSARILSLMTAHLTESVVLDFSVTDYAEFLKFWVVDIAENRAWSSVIDLTPLINTVQRLSYSAEQFDRYVDTLRSSQGTWWKFWDWRKSNAAIQCVNKIYISFERQFYYNEGIDGFPGQHHVLYEPSAWHRNDHPMPGLYKSLRNSNWTNAERWRNILVEKISDAARLLEHHMLERKQTGIFTRKKISKCVKG